MHSGSPSEPEAARARIFLEAIGMPDASTRASYVAGKPPEVIALCLIELRSCYTRPFFTEDRFMATPGSVVTSCRLGWRI